MTAWMEIAWKDVGVREIPGARADETILGYFRDAGRADILSDEVAWCAAFTGACLARAGVRLEIKAGRELLASSYLKVGTAIGEPRVGALAIVRRSGGSGYHVAFVAAWSETHVKLLGGNQADSVSEQWFSRGSVAAWRWPPVEATPRDVVADGSRIAGAAQAQQKDGAKGGGAEVLGHVAEYGAQAAGLAAVTAKAPKVDIQQVAEHAGSLQAALETIERFCVFAIGKGSLIGTCVAVYFLARMAWRAGWIKSWRAEDKATGKTT